MKREEALACVLESIERITGISRDEIRGETLLMQDLEMSSLEIMYVASDLEQASRSKIPAKTVRGFIRVRDMVGYLESV